MLGDVAVVTEGCPELNTDRNIAEKRIKLYLRCREKLLVKEKWPFHFVAGLECSDRAALRSIRRESLQILE